MNEFKTAWIVPVLLILALMAGCGDDDDPNGPVTADGLAAVNGLYYKGTMGSADLDTAMVFAVKDKSGAYIPEKWLYFDLLEGDGQMSSDSLKSGASGTVELEYDFSGDLGHAVIRATDRQTDTIDVTLRADILTPTVQGQYILLDDTYGDIVAYNGAPAWLDVFPDAPDIVVANYEVELGVAFVLYDVNQDGAIDDSAPVYGVIVEDSVYLQPPHSSMMAARYEGTTIEGVGIGDNFWTDVYPVLGSPQVRTDTLDGVVSWEMIYSGQNLSLWCYVSDSSVYQIDIYEQWNPSAGPPFADSRHDILRAVRSYYRSSDSRKEDNELRLDL